MVNKELLERKLVKLTDCIRKAEKYSSLDWASFQKDEIAQDVVEYNLFQSINLIIDMAQHIVTDEGWGDVSVMSDGFQHMYKKGLLTEMQYDSYKAMVGFRNIISHEYTNLDKLIVYRALKEKLQELKEFLVIVDNAFLKA